jgi:hypothetical protein
MPERSRTNGRPRDVNQIAAHIVEEATSEASLRPVTSPPEKNPHAAALGSLGGKKGGPARALSLSAEQRSAIAQKAATARWRNKDG